MPPINAPKLLGGLRSSNAAQAARGQSMAGAAQLGMQQQQANQQLGLQAMQQDSQLRQQNAANQTQRLQNNMQERLGGEQLANRQNVFDTNMSYDYRKLQKSKGMAWKQAALNAFAQEL